MNAAKRSWSLPVREAINVKFAVYWCASAGEEMEAVGHCADGRRCKKILIECLLKISNPWLLSQCASKPRSLDQFLIQQLVVFGGPIFGHTSSVLCPVHGQFKVSQIKRFLLLCLLTTIDILKSLKRDASSSNKGQPMAGVIRRLSLEDCAKRSIVHDLLRAIVRRRMRHSCDYWHCTWVMHLFTRWSLCNGRIFGC